jgi:predicted NAD/FAD-binding protein
MLQVRDRPIWRTITGGSKTYVERITRSYRDQIRLKTPVKSVTRSHDHVVVANRWGSEAFDEVIFACHSDQALKLLAHPTSTEREVLSKFPYSRNEAVLHTDASVMPRRRHVWSSWNYRIPQGNEQRPCVTYNMNILQRLDTSETICVTLNDEASIAPEAVLGRYVYHHPVFTIERRSAQLRHQELIRSARTSFCGAYWGNGFHEDGVNSALAVCNRFGIVPDWQQSPPVIDHRSAPYSAPLEVA